MYILISESDPRDDDIKTQFNYNTTTGLLNYTDDTDGLRTTYTYDPITDNLTKVATSVNGQDNSVSYGYTNRLLTAITHNGFDYLFEYDGFGRKTKISAGGEVIANNSYVLTDTTTVTTTYPTGEILEVTTDRNQQPISKKYSESSTNSPITLVENEYDEMGKLTKAVYNIRNTYALLEW